MTALALVFGDAPVDKYGIEWTTVPGAAVDGLLAEHHYLGPLASGGALTIAGLRDGEVVAAQIWKHPTSRRLPFGGSWLELARWCLTPAAGEYAGSRMHRQAVPLLRRAFPTATTLVSYSDPAQGHDGTLYRACNWWWRPTWMRLRPPPSGGGAWVPGVPQAVKDRWVFPLRPDAAREQVTRIDDPAAIRYWREHHTVNEAKWARSHPQLALL